VNKFEFGTELLSFSSLVPSLAEHRYVRRALPTHVCLITELRMVSFAVLLYCSTCQELTSRATIGLVLSFFFEGQLEGQYGRSHHGIT